MSVSHKAKSFLFAKELLACCTFLTILPGAIDTTQAANLGENCCADLQERIVEFDNIQWWSRRNRFTNYLMAFEVFREVMGIPLSERDKAIARLKSYSHIPFTHTMLEADKNFGNALMSCPQQGEHQAVTSEGQCHWFKLTGTISDRDTNSGDPGFNASSSGFAGGIQFALQNQWRFGFGGALERSNIDIKDATQEYSTSDGTRFTIGAVVKNQWGPINSYFSLTGSQGFYKTSRHININNIGDSANSHQKNSSLRANARFTALFDQGSFYLKPGIDFSSQYLHLSGYRETGAGGANITQSAIHGCLALPLLLKLAQAFSKTAQPSALI